MAAEHPKTALNVLLALNTVSVQGKDSQWQLNPQWVCAKGLGLRGSGSALYKRALSSLHRCVLGNTTILAEFASEEEISRFFAQGQSLTPSPGWQSLGSSQSRLGSIDGSHSFSNRNDLNHWNGAGLSGTSSGDLHGTSLWGSPNYSTSLWGAPSSSDTRGISSPSPINAFLSVDHLGGGGESM